MIEFFDEGTAELYNLASDVGERDNLAAKQPDRLRALQKKLAAWRRETGAVVPTVRQSSNLPE